VILLSAFLILGESITLDAHFSFLKLGELRLEVVGESVVDSDTLIHYRSLLKSNPALRFLFIIEDLVESWVEKGTLRPILSTRHIQEKNFKKKETIRFDWQKGYVFYPDHDSVPVDSSATDILTLFYKLRVIELRDSFDVIVHAGKVDHHIPCRLITRKRIKTPLGNLDTVGISLDTGGKGIFGKGDLEIWMTDDERRIPVVVKASFKFGSIIFRLSGYHA